MSLWILIPVAVVVGLLVGSFLTVVVDRVPRGESVMAPPSHCDNCDLRLGVRDLVPVVSWLVLRGRCRQCGQQIGVEPLLIELTNAAVFVLFALRFQDDVATMIAYWILGATLVALSWIDLKEHRLPREITRVGVVLGGIALIVAALVNDEPRRIWMAVLGALIALAIIGGIYLGANAYYGQDVAFGFGDVILSPLLGMYMGFLNPGIVAPGIFFGFCLGLLGAIPAMRSNDEDGPTMLPFGPFLALGTILAIFVGQHFVDLVLAR